MSTRFRRIASLVLTLCLAAGGSWADLVQVDATRANVRKQPSATSPIVTTVARGEQLEVLERTGDWYHVKTGSGAEGYVSARLDVPPTSEAEIHVPIPGAIKAYDAKAIVAKPKLAALLKELFG